MIKSHRSQKPLIDKPEKPYPDFPLYAHRNGCWAKKIRGKTVFFGPWHDWEGALADYNARKDDLHAGRTPKPLKDKITVKELSNEFLNAKKALVGNGELSQRTWDDYKWVCDLLIDQFGKNRLVVDLWPGDFQDLRKKIAAKWGLHRLAKAVKYARSVFKYAYDAEFIDKPIRFGPDFNGPSKKSMRLHKASQGPKLFTQEEILALIGQAGPAMKAMILLGINCGFGNADCGQLPLQTVNLDKGWVDFPRPKTGISRRCPLWPETVAALNDYLTKRPNPKDEADAGLLFLTKYGLPWFKNASWNPLTLEMTKLKKNLGIAERKGLGFYTLRHVFRTIADRSKDQPACDFIMGHESPHMSTVYRETIEDERLQAVVNVVRDWLFAK